MKIISHVSVFWLTLGIHDPDSPHLRREIEAAKSEFRWFRRKIMAANEIPRFGAVVKLVGKGQIVPLAAIHQTRGEVYGRAKVIEPVVSIDRQTRSDVQT